LLIVAFGANALADVTGTFSTHFSIRPQTTINEFSLLDFDVENDLTANFAFSGLISTFHTHFGIAGIEDVILTFNATLGALDVRTQLVFARFPYLWLVPFYDQLHFVKKSVITSLTIAGITLENLATFEDTNAFFSLTPAHAFGDVFQITGQTYHGTKVVATIGICMDKTPNNIKKHARLSDFSVNPDCATVPKPTLLFDFEQIQILNVPIVYGIHSSTVITCQQILACQLVKTLHIHITPIPMETSIIVSDLFGLQFGGAVILFKAGLATLELRISPTGLLIATNLNFDFILNPDSNPARLALDLDIAPGIGVADTDGDGEAATVLMWIDRLGLQFHAKGVLVGVGPVHQTATFAVSAPAGIFDLSSSATFGISGLVIANMVITISF
jgi:hypothetical protein